MTNAVKKGILAFMFPLLVANTLLSQTFNSGFENQTEGKKEWSAYGNDASRVSYPAEAAKSGKVGLKIVSPEGTPTQLFSLPNVLPIAMEAGKKYKLTYWVKPVEKGWGVKFSVYEGSFKKETGIELDFSTKKMKGNDWQQMSMTFTGNAMAKGKISITANRGTYLIDDVQIVEQK